MIIKVIRKDTGNVLIGEVCEYDMQESQDWLHLQVHTCNGEPYVYENEAYDWHNIIKSNCVSIEIL